MIQDIIARRQRAQAEVAADHTWQHRKNVTTETAYIDAICAGMERFNQGQPLDACRNPAECAGWRQAQALDVAEFYSGLAAYLDEMAGQGLDYLETVDEIVDEQYRRWGF
jgi:hypothetical protein